MHPVDSCLGMDFFKTAVTANENRTGNNISGSKLSGGDTVKLSSETVEFIFNMQQKEL